MGNELRKNRKYLLFYFSDYEKYEELGYESLGKLLLSGLKYADTGELPDFGDDKLLRYAWKEFKTDIDVGIENYYRKVSGGKKGGITKAVKDRLCINDSVISLINQNAIITNINNYMPDFEKYLDEKNLLTDYPTMSDTEKSCEFVNFYNKKCRGRDE